WGAEHSSLISGTIISLFFTRYTIAIPMNLTTPRSLNILIATGFCLLLFTNVAQAQFVESDERAILSVDEGINFTKDSLFLMNLRFRMQSRAGFNTISGNDLGVDKFEMRVRRLRLRCDGYVINP